MITAEEALALLDEIAAATAEYQSASRASALTVEPHKNCARCKGRQRYMLARDALTAAQDKLAQRLDETARGGS